jgi:hypothetical protein
VAGDALQGELTFEGVRYSSANAGTNISLVTSLKSSLPEVLDSFGRPVYGYKFGAVSTGITGDIMPRPLTVTGTASFDKVYDGTPDVVLTGLGLQGLVPGESLVLLAGTLAFADAGAAAGKAVSGVLELANGQNGRAANYVLAEGGVLATTATISPKPLTLLAGTVADKVYDGTTSAVIGAAGLQGLVGSETLTLVTTSGGFDTPDAGLAKAVDVSVALADGTGGGRAANYALSGGNTLSLRGNILPRPLELASLQVSDKVYDAKVDAQATSAGLSGLLPGQALNLSLQASFADSLAGAGKPVSVTAVLQDGAGGLAANYTLAGGAQRQSFASILPKEVVLRNMAVADKVYDGTREAVLQGGLLEGLLPGESLTLLPGTAVFDTADVGAGRPVVGVLALGDGAGGIAANYRLQDGSVSATASILPRPLNLSVAQVLDKTYDGTRSAVIVGGTLSGLVGSQTLSLETGSATFDTADAGVLKSVTLAVELGDGLNGGKASNYSLGDGSVLRLTGTIHPRPLNLTGVTVGDREYDGTNLAPASLGSLSGFVPGESVGARVDARFADRHVGDAKPVSIQIDLLDGPGGRASNYTLGAAAQQTTRASVLPRQVSVSGVSAVDKAYDGTTQATLRAGSFDGLVAGETLALAADARFDDKNVGSGKRVSGSVALADGNASASNYRLVNGGGFSGTASIVPRPADACRRTGGRQDLRRGSRSHPDGVRPRGCRARGAGLGFGRNRPLPGREHGYRQAGHRHGDGAFRSRRAQLRHRWRFDACHGQHFTGSGLLHRRPGERARRLSDSRPLRNGRGPGRWRHPCLGDGRSAAVLDHRGPGIGVGYLSRGRWWPELAQLHAATGCRQRHRLAHRAGLDDGGR